MWVLVGLLLIYFNPTQEDISLDTSNHGVRVVFPVRTEKPIIHATNSLTPAECNKSEVKNEVLPCSGYAVEDRRKDRKKDKREEMNKKLGETSDVGIE